MLGGEVNKTNGGDICTRAQLEGGDVCGAGVTGTGNGEFSVQSVIGVAGDYVDIGPTGTVYVGDKDRVQAFELDGDFVGQIPFADVNAEDSRFPASGNPGALAVDSLSGDIYFAFAQGVLEQEKVHGVYRLDEGGELVDVLEAVGPKAPGNFDSPESLATDLEGNVFLALVPRIGGIQQPHRVMEFDSMGDTLIPFSEGFTAPQRPSCPASTSIRSATSWSQPAGRFCQRLWLSAAHAGTATAGAAHDRGRVCGFSEVHRICREGENQPAPLG